MAMDPKKGGKCWSCKHCTDIGSYEHNEKSPYFRKCNCSGKEPMAPCVTNCASYVWNGKGANPTNATSKPAEPAVDTSSIITTSDVKETAGFSKIILIVAVLLVAALIAVFAITFSKYEPKEEPKVPETSDFVPDEPHIEGQPAVIIYKEELNLREKNTTKSDIVASMPSGATVYVLAEDGEWSQVNFEGYIGWCKSKHLEYVD